jgi:hypothetical protein
MNEDEFTKWLNSFYDYMEPEDGSLYIIRSPKDLQTVHKDLEKILGEYFMKVNKYGKKYIARFWLETGEIRMKEFAYFSDVEQWKDELTALAATLQLTYNYEVYQIKGD